MQFAIRFRKGCMLMNLKSFSLLLLMVLLAATLATAQESAMELQKYGTIESPTAPKTRPSGVVVSTVSTSEVFSSANYGTGGVALRNRRTGSAAISGVTGPVQAARAYWAVITAGSTLPLSDKKLTITRQFPPPSAGITVTGTVVGTGGSPCWGGFGLWVLKATVPTTVASGNGLYKLTISGLAGTAGSTDGGDPWVEPPAFPLWEGASLVVVGTGSNIVSLYDSGLAGTLGIGSLAYTLALITPTSGGTVLWDTIGADGQLGASRLALASGEATSINGVAVSGPGAPAVSSDWDGITSGSPLPQLWDDTGHDITAAAPAGTTSLAVSVIGTGTTSDCINAVANVVSQ